ncbi:MAG: uroporphyrinogen decarboxylase family protein [Candidatus Hodarchaeota archaeon]
MNARERFLAIFDDIKRKELDKIPTHVQYVREEFISKYRNEIMNDYQGRLFNNIYFDIPYILGFESIFAPFPLSYKINSIRVRDSQGKFTKIKENGQSIKQKTTYYEGGFINTTEILDELWTNLKIVDKSNSITKSINYYEKLAPYIFPVLTVDGIFDRVWKSMGMTIFAKNFQKNTKLYKSLIEFYAELTKINIKGLINATGDRGKVVALLDDVAFKGRSMISKDRWNQDFLPCYKEILSIILDAKMIPIIHTDGDPTELIPSFQNAGFRGLQGWEGGADPKYINENFPEFVIIGFGDVSYVLPFGDQEQVQTHVKELINILKNNRRFIIGPSTVIFQKIPLRNVKIFINEVTKYGTY